MRNALSLPNERHRSRRMQDLANLPVFFRLKDKRAIVAGGSDAAAWKAELLAATGAQVHVFAVRADETLQALVGAGTVIHYDRAWTAEDLAGASIAICDAETDEEAGAFVEASRAAGVPVNVIDRPAWCDFQFGSIVNRSPVVVAISTDGAAPILGQAIRRRIEALLPRSLAEWAALARDLRDTIASRLASGVQRRAFWEYFVDRAFGPGPSGNVIGELTAETATIAAGIGRNQGRVTLVGAGPGEAELLTLKAIRALQAADVILFDAQVSDEVLELARREAKRVLVGAQNLGENGGREGINDRILRLIGAGKHVVRLVTGDPMSSSQTRKEISGLAAEGIAVAVVPGIPSAIAPDLMHAVSITRGDCARLSTSIRAAGVYSHATFAGLRSDI